jgi:hypothetical protein
MHHPFSLQKGVSGIWGYGEWLWGWIQMWEDSRSTWGCSRRYCQLIGWPSSIIYHPDDMINTWVCSNIGPLKSVDQWSVWQRDGDLSDRLRERSECLNHRISGQVRMVDDCHKQWWKLLGPIFSWNRMNKYEQLWTRMNKKWALHPFLHFSLFVWP